MLFAIVMTGVWAAGAGLHLHAYLDSGHAFNLAAVCVSVAMSLWNVANPHS